MMVIQHIKMAINSLKNNRIRTFLTLLGIIIGVMSVTTIIALGEGVKRQVNQQISDLGSNMITIVPGRNATIGNSLSLDGVFDSGSSAAHLTEADLNSVRQIENVAQAGGAMQIDGSVQYGEKRINTRILGVEERHLDLTRQKIAKGQFFGGDLENNNTVVLSSDVADKLFGARDPIGSTLSIRGTNFIVIGVLSPYKGLNFGQSPSNAVMIPLPAAKRFNQDIVQLQQIGVMIANDKLAEQTSQTIKQHLLQNHGNEEDFTITTQGQLVNATDSVFHLLTGFTAAVAAISLLVGGIGVMNIMLVTVTERTKEIGIRKAIGATKVQIMMQFLVEALIITLVGGAIGILVSFILGYIISTQTALKPSLDLWIVVFAATISLLVGIVFGTWPALRAARKDPINSLRHD